jgi:hypothetical protein
VRTHASPPGGPVCPRCGAPHEPGQEYCLDCGDRLSPAAGLSGRLSGAWQARFGWYPGAWFWRVLLGLVIAIAGATAAIVLTDAGAENNPIVATLGGQAHTPTPAPETATVTLPSVATETGPPSTPSIPTSAGRSLALARARAASTAGLPQVGILDSGRYSSLHPGYYVVFSGIYASKGQADSAQATAAEKGFRLAYSREITR